MATLTYLVLVGIAIAVIYAWTTRVRVSPAPVAMMPTRLVFPAGLRLDDPDRAVSLLANPDEIIIPFDHATLIIEFPLTTPATIPITSSVPQGFTRRELVKAICEEYANVYEAEEATAATKTIPLAERSGDGVRNRTDGVYGIWGHDLHDLVLTAARWSRKQDGMVTVELHVERSREKPA